MRKKILSGEMADSGWSECSVDSMHDPQDVDAWYETNPSLGIRLQERVVRAEITTDEVDFNVQRLGYGCLIIRTHVFHQLNGIRALLMYCRMFTENCMRLSNMVTTMQM